MTALFLDIRKEISSSVWTKSAIGTLAERTTPFTMLLRLPPWRAAESSLEYLEIFHSRQRHHSSLGMLTPIQYEKLNQTRIHGAGSSQPDFVKPGEPHQTARKVRAPVAQSRETASARCRSPWFLTAPFKNRLEFSRATGIS
jgi:putative transposase